MSTQLSPIEDENTASVSRARPSTAVITPMRSANDEQKQIAPLPANSNLNFSGQQVHVQVIERAQPITADFFIDAYDKIIIPFSALSLAYEVDGRANTIELTPGQGLFIPAAVTEMDITGITCEEYLMLDVDAELRRSACADFAHSLDHMSTRLTILDGTQYLLKFAQTARRLLLSPCGQSTKTVQAIGFMAVIETLFTMQSRAKISTRLTSKMLAGVDEYIKDHIDEALRLQDLAGVCGMSTHHFARSFKALTGRTPYQHILDKRVMIARRKLVSSTLSIAEVAYDTGFSSQSHMTEIFRRMIGVTPGKVRDQSAELSLN